MTPSGSGASAPKDDRDSGLRVVAATTAVVALASVAGAGVLALEVRNASANPTVQPSVGTLDPGGASTDDGSPGAGDGQALQPPAFDPNAVPQDQLPQDQGMQPPVTSGS